MPSHESFSNCSTADFGGSRCFGAWGASVRLIELYEKEPPMNTNSKPAWTLIIATLFLLMAMGKLDLLFILVPLSLLLGYGLLCLGGTKTRLTNGMKKR
jgi:hypothetical protein